MTKHIEGFCNFEENDELTVNGIPVAVIISLDDEYLAIHFYNHDTEILAGKKFHPETDHIINAVWNTLNIINN